MNFANFIPAILGILGLTAFQEKDGKKSLSDEERATLKGYGFSDKFLDDFAAALNDPAPAVEPSKDRQDAALKVILGNTVSQLTKTSEELEALKTKNATDAQAHAAAIKAKETEIAALNAKIKTLSELPESDPGKGAGQSGANPEAFNLDDTEQLGGMSGEFFSLDRPYNMRAKAALLAAQGQSLAVAVANEIHLHTVLRQLLRLLLCRPGHMLEIGMVFRTRNKKTDLQFLLHHRQSLRYLIGPVVQFLHNGLYTLFRLCIHHTPVVQNAVNRPDRYPRLFGNLFNRRHAVISPCFLPLYRCFCL